MQCNVTVIQDTPETTRVGVYVNGLRELTRRDGGDPMRSGGPCSTGRRRWKAERKESHQGHAEEEGGGRAKEAGQEAGNCCKGQGIDAGHSGGV